MTRLGPIPSGGRPLLARAWSGWTAVALVCVAVLVLWLPDLDLPLGNSDDGRLVGRAGLQARNFWELGPLESGFGARIDPYVRPGFGAEPRSDPPIAAVSYAHHPPLTTFIAAASVGVLGDSLAALRIAAFCLGAATIAFMAALLRGCGVGWGPTLLATGAMASTGFFYVYGRIGVGFALLVASAAAVAWHRNTEQPPRWALIGTGALAAATAMQSWIALASLALLALWLFASRASRPDRPRPVSAETRLQSLGRRLASGWSVALAALVVGAAVGAFVTAAWLLNGSGLAELGDQVALRADRDAAGGSRAFGFGEFLSRQWSFATEELMVPPWLRVLLAPALLAGLIDRRTRVPTGIMLAMAATLTFGFQQGAWTHRLWNFPWLAPVTIGLAALLDAARRVMPARLRSPAFWIAGAAIAATAAAVVAGGTRDRYISDPAQLGEALEEAAASDEAARAELAWTGPGLPTPRWASYYLDVPAWALDESRLDELEDSDLVILRAGMVPEFLPEGALEDPLASAGDFRVITAASLSP
ncbi:MAG: hypothetical protein OXC06_19390 [Acidimicrobiaceae bacterium]|nr:hypothetical protein [Acidimicrobiaceae bacterium]